MYVWVLVPSIPSLVAKYSIHMSSHLARLYCKGICFVHWALHANDRFMSKMDVVCSCDFCCHQKSQGYPLCIITIQGPYSISMWKTALVEGQMVVVFSLLWNHILRALGGPYGKCSCANGMLFTVQLQSTSSALKCKDLYRHVTVAPSSTHWGRYTVYSKQADNWRVVWFNWSSWDWMHSCVCRFTLAQYLWSMQQQGEY